MTPTTTVPTRRNALVTWAIPTACFVAAPPLGAALGTTMFRLAPTFAILAGVAILFGFTAQMLIELRSVAPEHPLVAWHLLIPFWGLYWAAVLVPRAMTAAKARAGKSAPRSTLAYLFAFPWAFASDLNDLAA